MKTVKSLFWLGLAPFLFLFLFAPSLCPFVFGKEWEPVGYYIRIFAVMYYAKFVVNPVTYIVYIISKQSYNIWFQLLKFISMVVAFVLGYYFDNLNLGLAIWTILTTFSYIIIFLISYRLSFHAEYLEK